MKTLNERLDHVLQTLIGSGGDIYLMCIDTLIRNNKKETLYRVTDEYNKMFKPLELDDVEFIELLEILQEKKYIYFDILTEKESFSLLDPTIRSPARIFLKDIETEKVKTVDKNFEGYKLLLNAPSPAVYLGQCQMVRITLNGKFYREQGGFQGEENIKNTEKNRIKKQDEQIRLLTLFLAIGSIGVLLIEAMKFLLDYF